MNLAAFALLGALASSPAHSLTAGASFSDRDFAMGELSYLLHMETLRLGLQLQAGAIRNASVFGQVREGGLRLRVRVPVLIRLAQLSSIRLDSVIAPGYRLLNTEEASASALTAELGLLATFSLHEKWRLFTGFTLPFAVDLNGDNELARFPGITLSAGLLYNWTDRFALILQGHASAPEGYNGDGEKSVFEASLLFQFSFGDRGTSTAVIPPLSGSI